VGDRIYGHKRKKAIAKPPAASMVDEFPRQALHAEKLLIDHVRTDHRMEFCARLPKDLQDLLGFLRDGKNSVGLRSKRISTNRG